LAKLTYRGVAVVVPEGEAVEALLARIDDTGLGRRLMRSLNPSAQAGWRKLVMRLYLSGLQDGIDRAIELDPDAEEASPAESIMPDETPVALDDLRADGGREMRSPVQAVVDRYRRSVLKVPHLPEGMIRLNRLLSDTDADVGEVVELIERDPVLKGRVMAQAAGLNGGRAPRTLNEAVVRVGIRDVTRCVLAAGNRALFGFATRAREGDLRDLWQHSLATALMAEILAGDLEGAHPGSFFLHGLLHDVGRAVLLKIFDDIESEASEEGPFTREEVARTIDGLHGQFGHALLQKWGFGDTFAEVALFHHQPHKAFSHRRLVAAVGLADALACRLGYGGESHAIVGDEPAEHPSARTLGLTAEVLEFAARQLKRSYEALVGGI
jgi:HD-like signal output (HDOD) protein